ncbi:MULTISPECIES: tyrosine-type recombinase/integrase [Halorussus]|uniref:tyrosine-type recombinase/integrase n=1 Tax=Halorussus TaxID=1070314 RepID=UPI0020A19CF9|nr:site-specific integrase [Halorussus vallis]USZ74998.1 site-specific integrase [Halorussus vallis]
MTDDFSADKERLAEAFGQEIDPLAKYEATFEATGIDPFDLFADEVLDAKSITPRTRAGYHRLFKQWRAHMHEQGRHPACLAEQHLRSFIYHERDDKGNHPGTVKEKVRKLEEVYRYWQASPSFPHSSEYNPFTIVKQTVALDAPEQKPLPRIPLVELRDFVGRVKTLRNLAIVLMQLKLGLRATEVCNLPLGELNLQDEELQTHFQSLGNHWMLNGRPNAVYIPHDRFGNKSGRPRVLPLDTELQDVLTRYLLVRPDSGEPWIFLSEKGNKLRRKVVSEIWRDVFHPKYAETEHHRPVSSHYGRHRFTSYWRVEQDLPRPLVKYMRGDRPDSESITERAGIDDYIHTYYEDIESVHRREIYRLL